MEETMTCFCGTSPEEPEKNFGWTRALFCQEIGQVRTLPHTDAQLLTFEKSLWQRVTLAQFKAAEDLVKAQIRDKKAAFDPEDAYDLVRETLRLFPKYFRNWSSSRNKWVVCYGNLVSSFKQLCKWQFQDKLKTHKTASIDDTLQLGDDTVDFYKTFQETQYKEDFLTALENAMQQLKQTNPKYYEVVYRFSIENKTHDQIAEELGISKDDSQQTNKRGRAKLKELISAKMEGKYPNFNNRTAFAA